MRTTPNDNLTLPDWEIKAGGRYCLCCDGSKAQDSLCCDCCWLHLTPARQLQIINLLRRHTAGYAMKKLASMFGKARLPSRKEVIARTAKLFKEAMYA